MKIVIGIILLLAVAAQAKIYYQEDFSGDWESRWVQSDAKKSEGSAGKLKVTAGKWYGDEEADKGAQTSQDARFYFYTSKLDEPFSNEGKDLVFQFSVKHEQKIDCGGGYLKLLPADVDQKSFNGDSPYLIMMGPDICGTSTKRVHAIINHEGENLLTTKETRCETDQLTHVYTFWLKADGTYELRIDGKVKASGALKEHWDFEQPEEIPDPDAKKPEDWVDEAEIDDPEDTKPDDWDNEPKEIEDPDAVKPDDWDDEEDGDWEAPMVPNPKWKGEWKPKKIPNPEYKGEWVHPMIANPDYEEVTNFAVFDSIGAIGLDIWQVKSGTIFDNVIVTDSIEEAEEIMADTFSANKDAEKKMFDDAEAKRRKEEEETRKKVEEEAKKQEEDDEEEEEDDEEEDEDEDDEEDDEAEEKVRGHEDL